MSTPAPPALRLACSNHLGSLRSLLQSRHTPRTHPQRAQAARRRSSRTRPQPSPNPSQPWAGLPLSPRPPLPVWRGAGVSPLPPSPSPPQGARGCAPLPPTPSPRLAGGGGVGLPWLTDSQRLTYSSPFDSLPDAPAP